MHHSLKDGLFFLSERISFKLDKTSLRILLCFFSKVLLFAEVLNCHHWQFTCFQESSGLIWLAGFRSYYVIQANHGGIRGTIRQTLMEESFYEEVDEEDDSDSFDEDPRKVMLTQLFYVKEVKCEKNSFKQHSFGFYFYVIVHKG